MNIMKSDCQTKPNLIIKRATNVEIIGANITMLILTKQILISLSISQTTISRNSKQTRLIVSGIILVSTKVSILAGPTSILFVILCSSYFVKRNIL